MSLAPPLTATYRVQLSSDFDLEDARSIVAYVDHLGISHLYASPILSARAGSTHGYDVVDPRRVNGELGGEGARIALVTELRARGLGMILDIVPNHMGTGAENPFWMDVLRNGAASQYAAWFDIDWNAPGELRGRVLLPVLGDTLDAVIARGEVRVLIEAGAPCVHYFEHRFPLAPGTEPDESTLHQFDDDDNGRARLRALLDRQHYLLADWHRAATEINYRRFFDINELAGVRVEDPRVFDATHARVLSWAADGTVDGLRVDHIDGLSDPLQYLQRLRAALDVRRPEERVPIFVEKILSPGERLRTAWPVDGTTGYEFLNDLESIFVSADGAQTIESYYRTSVISDRRADFHDVAVRGKLHILRTSLAADVARLVRMLADPAVFPIGTTPPTRPNITRAIRELIAALPVYRTYIDGRTEPGAEDRSLIQHAADEVRRRWPESAATVDLLATLMLQVHRDESAAQSFTLRFQQTSGPATAKGVEDTALYRYVPLASLDEVGGSPDRPLADAVATLHQANAERAKLWLLHLLATSTHDTKRSADVRARLNVLSEMPEAWVAQVKRWRLMNRLCRSQVGRRSAPDPNTEYLLYQTLVGVWELDGDEQSHARLAQRVDAYMRKATREARLRTNWTEPDTDFEQAVSQFVHALLLGDGGAAFRADMERFVRPVIAAGTWNALARTVVHLSAPGTPDVYQGDELWNFSLVDPDNRRSVDYGYRQKLLDELDRRVAGAGERGALCKELLAHVQDDRLKLYIVWAMLQARRADPTLFGARYVRLDASGSCAEHVFAFARVSASRVCVSVVPRMSFTLAAGTAPMGREVWRDTSIVFPQLLSGLEWHNAFTGAILKPAASLDLADLLGAFPVAFLTTAASSPRGADGSRSQAQR